MINCLRLIFLSLLLAGILNYSVRGQQKIESSNADKLDIVANMTEYQKLVSANPEKSLVDLEKFIPGILLDIRYATKNNFTGQQIYPFSKAYVRKPVAEALLKIQKELSTKGLGLKIYDAYRPYDATVRFFEIYRDTNFVASPRTGSRHNRACSVDVTIVDLSTKKELEMPTGFDDFSQKASFAFSNLPVNAIKNRTLLKNVMIKYGFISIPSEWWHYDYSEWRYFELMNISFQELKNIKNEKTGL